MELLKLTKKNFVADGAKADGKEGRLLFIVNLRISEFLLRVSNHTATSRNSLRATGEFKRCGERVCGESVVH